MSKFIVGDLVMCLGLKGVVGQVDVRGTYPVYVYFESGAYCTFTADGRMDISMRPSLKLRRFKKKEPKYLYVVTNGKDVYTIYKTLECAQITASYHSSNKVLRVRIIGEVK